VYWSLYWYFRAQIGSYVPADYVELTPFDAVYTRMGARDDIGQGLRYCSHDNHGLILCLNLSE